MRKPKHLWLTGVLSVLSIAALGLSTPVQASNLRERLWEAQSERAGLELQIREAQSELNEIEAHLAETHVQLAMAEAEHERLWQEFLVLDAERVKAEAAAEQAEAELAAMEAELAEQTDLLGKRLRALQERGHIHHLEVVFQSTSFQDFLSRWELLTTLLRYDNEILQKVSDARDRAAAKRDELVFLREEARQKAMLAANRNVEAAERKAQIERMKADFEAQREEYLDRIRVLEEESERISALIRELEREIARQVGKLNFRFPVDSVRITDNYGMRWHPILGTQRMHYGVDFAVNMGAPIYAVEDGVVIVADYDEVYGYKVIISHGELNGQTVSTLYAHNSELLVHVGQEVRKGQQIARAGSTGWSTGPHCHFEVRLNGTPTNPWDGWLPQ